METENQFRSLYKNFRSEFYLLHKDAEKRMEMKQNKRFSRSKCSSSEILKITGYKLCSDVSYMQPAYPETSAYFPLTGPVTINFGLHKKDAPGGYKLQAKRIMVRLRSYLNTVFRAFCCFDLKSFIMPVGPKKVPPKKIEILHNITSGDTAILDSLGKN